MLLGACGRLGFDPGTSSDARIDAPATECTGTTHTIVDNFDDNVFDEARWGNTYFDNLTAASEETGRLVIHVAASSPDDWAGYVSTLNYDLRGDRVFVEVPVVPPNSIAVLYANEQLGVAGNGVSVEYETDRLIARSRVDGQIVEHANLPYDPVAHRWWQLRERAGQILWEAAPDGLAWQTIASALAPIPTSAVWLTLAAGATNAEPMTEAAAFDNFNGGNGEPPCLP